MNAHNASISLLQGLLLSLSLAACGGGQGGTTSSSAQQAPAPPKLEEPQFLATSPNGSGVAATYSKAGFIDQSNPFFKPFGNGRSCASCHQQDDGWSLTPANTLARFNRSGGSDPLFQALDAANSPLADTSTPEARRAAYSMLLNKGVIRIGRPVPADAEFALAAADDPYGYASGTELSLFRRPLPTANLRFLADVMWDGRDTHKDAGSASCISGTTHCYAPLDFNLRHQANRAVLAHAQAASDLSSQEQQSILEFQMALFTAQLSDSKARGLTAHGAAGGPLALATTEFYFGINDPDSGDYRTRKPFTSQVITPYTAWNAPSASLADEGMSAEEAEAVTLARKSIARGQTLFNNKPIFIDNVGGIRNTSVRGTCTTCHNAPQAGSRSIPLMLNIGVADAARRTADLPLYTLRNSTTGETIRTTDPGAALSTGKWQDIGRFKVPVLRGLASRPPYFHNGSAQDLREVVRFYDERFAIGFTERDINDLAAFLGAL